MNNRGRGEERLRLAELLRREYAVRKDTADQEDALQEAAAALHQPEADALYRTRLKTAIETLSNGTNTVIYDDFGQPSIMTYIPPLQEKDLLPSSTSAASTALGGSRAGPLRSVRPRGPSSPGKPPSMPWS